MIMHPEALRAALLERVGDYPKSLVTRLIPGPAVGHEPFVTEGTEWRWQRPLRGVRHPPGDPLR